MNKVFLNGRILPASQARISVFDHGFLYGDGIYETVRVYDSQIFHWPAHYRRLKHSAHKIHLSCPWSSAYLEKAIIRLVRANHVSEASVRLTISRGPGALGLDPALCPTPTLAMMLHPVRDVAKVQREGVAMAVPHIRRTHPKCLDPKIKANNALNTILAKVEAKRMGAFEAVLLNLEGYLAEGTTTNLFWVKGLRLFTPALSCGLLEGVTRGLVIALARKAGYRVSEGRYTLSDLRRASEIFLTSTTLELVPVVRVVGKTPNASTSLRPFTVWRGSPGPVTRRLQADFFAGRNR